MHTPARVATALTALALALSGALAGAAHAVVLPIPPGPLDATVPAYVGAPVEDRPVRHPRIPQHPFMAPTGLNSMHNDAYASDAYLGGGPRGDKLQVTSATYGILECATVTFDSRARLVALCGGLEGFKLMLIDPDTLEAYAEMTTSVRDLTSGANPFSDLCGGAYFYLDHRDRAIVETVDGTVMVVQVTQDGFELLDTYDASSALPDGDCLIALMPDWDGLIWFVTKDGGVGTIDPGTRAVRSIRLDGEAIVNSFATDETGGVFIVSDHALYRFDARRDGTPAVTWREAYDRGSRHKPGQLSQGSGTTPTLIGRNLVVITDNADPRMRVLSFKRRAEKVRKRQVCSVPVFEAGRSATENTIAAVGRSVVVENNYGYESPLTPVLGQVTAPGVSRVKVTRKGCGTMWESDVVAPTSVPKISLRTGLLYVYSKPEGVPSDPWYFTAIDVRTGETAWKQLTGTGPQWNNHYAAIYLGPDRAAYVATMAGLIRITDG